MRRAVLRGLEAFFRVLGGSAVSFELGAEREKVMSLLFEEISNEMVRDGIYSLALSRFAHDTEANNSLILNGFGIMKFLN